jgi:uncharacterized protein YcnI
LEGRNIAGTMASRIMQVPTIKESSKAATEVILKIYRAASAADPLIQSAWQRPKDWSRAAMFNRTVCEAGVRGLQLEAARPWW